MSPRVNKHAQFLDLIQGACHKVYQAAVSRWVGIHIDKRVYECGDLTTSASARA